MEQSCNRNASRCFKYSTPGKAGQPWCARRVGPYHEETMVFPVTRLVWSGPRLHWNLVVSLFHLIVACHCFLLCIPWFYGCQQEPVDLLPSHSHCLCITIKFSLPICPTLRYIVYAHILSNIKLLVLTCRDVSGMILLFRMAAAVSLPLAAVLILLIDDHQQHYSELKRGKRQLLYKVCWTFCCLVLLQCVCV